MTEHGLCDFCATLKRLKGGLIALHYVRVPERVRATSRTRQVRRQCPGSGRAPRQVEP
jgi:hypothetical protein